MTWIDWIVVAVLVVGLAQGLWRGFIAQAIQIIALILGTALGFMASPLFAGWMERQLQLPTSLTRPLALVVAIIVVTSVLQFVASIVVRLIGPVFQANPLNRIGGLIVGGIRQALLVSVVLAVLVALPLSASVKQTLDHSRLVQPFLDFALFLEKKFGGTFRADSLKSLNYQLIGSDDQTTQALNYTVENPTTDLEAEGKLFLLTNTLRQQNNKPALVPNEKLRQVAENHARDMLQKGYFSHLSPPPTSQDALDRVQASGLKVSLVGENLATASTIEIAQAGLLASTGHRNTLLSEAYNQVGIGVLDAGAHGKMIVEVFAHSAE